MAPFQPSARGRLRRRGPGVRLSAGKRSRPTSITGKRSTRKYRRRRPAYRSAHGSTVRRVAWPAARTAYTPPASPAGSARAAPRRGRGARRVRKDTRAVGGPAPGHRPHGRVLNATVRVDLAQAVISHSGQSPRTPARRGYARPRSRRCATPKPWPIPRAPRRVGPQPRSGSAPRATAPGAA